MRRVLLPPTISAEPPPAGALVADFSGVTMGTTWSARVALAADAVPYLQAGLQQQLDQVVAEMSHWEPGSDLGRFNRAGGGAWQVLPDDFFQVLHYALEVSRETGGACDPCAGALVNLWGFGPTGRHDEAGFVAPGARDVATVKAYMAGRAVELDLPRKRAYQPGGVQLDLSAVAKGFSVDKLARWLEGAGCQHYLVEVGGELRGAGFKPDGQSWWVALEEPLAGQDEIAVALHGLAVATSGDYRKYFMQDAIRRPHTIDPRTGMPITNALASVTVVHESAMAADAWSTALTVLGPEQGLALAERKRLAARFLLRDEAGLREILSSRFQKMLEDE